MDNRETLAKILNDLYLDWRNGERLTNRRQEMYRIADTILEQLELGSQRGGYPFTERY